MVARITHDTTIGMSAELLASVDAWAKHENRPRSEYCRLIIERHQKRIGLMPPETPEIDLPNPLALTPSN